MVRLSVACIALLALLMGAGDVQAIPSAPSIGNVVCYGPTPEACNPSYTPSFGVYPTQPKPPSPTQEALEREIKVRQNEAAKLGRRREVWQVALEKIQAGQAWRDELLYWGEESQAAQVGALDACLDLFLSRGGLIESRIEARLTNTFTATERAVLAQRLEDISLVMSQGRFPARTTSELQALALDFFNLANDSVKNARTEAQIADRLRDVQRVGDKLLKGARYAELGEGLFQKRNQLLLTKLLADYWTNAAKFLVMTATETAFLKAGARGPLAGVKFAAFLIDYGYNSARFAVSWVAVDQLLVQTDNVNVVSQTLSRKIVEATNQRAVINADIKRLQAARGDDNQAQIALQEQRTRDIENAYQTGVTLATSTP